jgi:chemotaxis protein methyltransferase CheR
VLIYFDRETKKQVLERMKALMPDDGFLVLGAAETVLGITDAFGPMSGQRGLYRPKSGAAGKSASARPAPALKRATA